MTPAEEPRAGLATGKPWREDRERAVRESLANNPTIRISSSSDLLDALATLDLARQRAAAAENELAEARRQIQSLKDGTVWYRSP